MVSIVRQGLARNLRRWLTTAVGLMWATCLVVWAPSAHAATPVQVTCSESSITIYGAVGDEFEFSSAGVCNDDWEINNTSDVALQNGAPGWLQYITDTNVDQYTSNGVSNWWFAYFQDPRPSSVTVRLMATNMNGSPFATGDTIAVFDNDMAVGGRSIVIPIVFGGQRSAVATDEPWTVIRQSLPLPNDGACATVADSDYAWGSGLSGGWLKSWEPWVNAGQGGWACNRTLVNKGGPGWMIDNAA